MLLHAGYHLLRIVRYSHKKQSVFAFAHWEGPKIYFGERNKRKKNKEKICRNN